VPDSGSSTGEIDEVTVSIDTTGLVAGDYAGNVTVSAPGANNSPQTIHVSLSITSEGAIICHSPFSLTFSALEGFNPDSQALEIWNCNGPDTTLSWSVSDDAGWLQLSPTSGSSVGEPDHVTVSVTSWNLSPGVSHAVITIAAAGAGNSPQSVPVSLEVIERTFDEPPAAPTDLVATADTGQINLVWTDNADNELGFIIFSKHRPLGFFYEIGRVGANVTTYQDTDVECGRTYYYGVCAWNYVRSSMGRYFVRSEWSNVALAECSTTGGRCFIATAAYDSADEKCVQALRGFRDGYMAIDGIGSGVLSAYYKVSPRIAEFIDTHPSLKPAVRIGLLPVVGVSSMATAGASLKIAVCCVAALGLVLAAAWVYRRRLATWTS